jgi:hypothetical protein
MPFTLDMYAEFAQLLNTAQAKPLHSGSAGVRSRGPLIPREMMFRIFWTIIPEAATARRSK